MFPGEPGYCIACGDYHLLTPVPEWGGPACAQCVATRRLDPPEAGPRHVCNVSARLKPGHPEYRQCSCGQWLHSGRGYWYRVDRPPLHWLREHGLADPYEFLAYEEREPRPSFGEAFMAGPGGWRAVLRAWLRR